MGVRKSDLQTALERFGEVLAACREVTGDGRVEMFDPDNAPRSLGWMVFFRAMNLSEAAVLCAKARLGEAVWLTTRCLEELAYLTKSLGPGLERACTFLAADAHNHAEWLEKRSKDLPGADADLKDRMAKAAKAQIAQLPSKPADWPDRVRQRAAEAGMEHDHALSYRLFSDLAHHGHRSFDTCTQQCKDGLQVNSRMADDQIVLALVNAAYYWALVVDALFGLLGVVVTPRFRKAFHALEREIVGPKAGEWS